MMLSILAASVVGAAAWADPSDIIEKPQWGPSAPTPRVMRFYPLKAQREGRSGVALVQCEIAAEGSLTSCVVLAEGPAGYEFGKAALGLASLFRMKAEALPPSRRFVQVPISMRVGATGLPSFDVKGLVTDSRCYTLATHEPGVGSPSAGGAANDFGSRIITMMAEIGFTRSDAAQWLADATKSVDADPVRRASLRTTCAARAEDVAKAPPKP